MTNEIYSTGTKEQEQERLSSGYWNLCGWYSMLRGRVCVHVQHHNTGHEAFVNVSREFAEDRWGIGWAPADNLQYSS